MMTREHSAPRWAVTVGVVALGAVLAGCSGSSSTAAHGTTGGSGATGTSGATSGTSGTTGASTGASAAGGTGGAGGSTAGGGSAPAGIAVTGSTAAGSTGGAGGATASSCRMTQLKLSAGAVSAGMGQRYVAVIFTNVGTTPCTIGGYPGIAGLDSAGRQVTQARRSTGYPTPTLRLLPGGSASAVVHATVVPSGNASSCPADYPAILVTPPNLTTSTTLTVDLPSCSGLDVRPLVAGRVSL